jgi:FAD:protein FMN transferase
VDVSRDAHPFSLRHLADHWVGSFRAMASPCGVLAEVGDRRDAERILSIVTSEARRVESKFSRYLPDSVVSAIHRGAGSFVAVDAETERLLDFAGRLHDLSRGRFDITSGALRAAWTFDGSDRVPAAAAIARALSHVGWTRVRREPGRIRLEPGMEIDLGGIGKEYAVDNAARLVADAFEASCVVNFGGDLRVTGPRRDGAPWRVGIEDPARADPTASRVVHISRGALATSGDSRRYILRDGVRYGHILDPRSGWPVREAPRSVTVAAATCTEAGMLATLAMLEGPGAESFLAAQGVRYWIARG